MIQFRLKELIARKERLERRRITYAVITEETRISPSTLSRLANNSSEMVGLSVIDRLCSFLGCAPGELLVQIGDGDEADGGRAGEDGGRSVSGVEPARHAFERRSN